MFDLESRASSSHLGTTGFADMFDPFDDLDRMMSRNSISWLDKPAFLDFTPFKMPRAPRKYRISLNCQGYSSKSIKTEVKDGKLIVTGSEGNKAEALNGEDYTQKEFRKSFALPADVEVDKLASFITSSGQLVVEIPLRASEEAKASTIVTSSSVANKTSEAAVTHIVDGENGLKNVMVKMSLPKNVDPNKINVTCKDRDLIVKVEDIEEKPDRCSQTYYYQKTSLPEGTDFKSMKCLLENDQLTVSAPLLSNSDAAKPVSIELKSN